MSEFRKNLKPLGMHAVYDQALSLATSSEFAAIGHIDTGITPHPGLGFEDNSDDLSKTSIILDDDSDLLDDGPAWAKFGPKPKFLDKLTDWPDHGTKTLSIILSDVQNRLHGVAPGVAVIPIRIADGPIFQDDTQRDLMGPAIRRLVNHPRKPRVISISMGNPGHMGFFEFPKKLISDVSPGLSKDAKRAVDEAYEAGVAICAAGGQVIDRVVFPARLFRTIAVGGLSPSDDHYPPHGYGGSDMSLVDVWALATNVNRASSTKSNGEFDHIWAEDEKANRNEPDKVTGTSYATPQVAAATMLWMEWNRHNLPDHGDPEGWKSVEAARLALRDSAQKVSAKLGGRKRRMVRKLDIEELLKTPVPDLSKLKRHPPAAKQRN